jgi:YVTN family beta-propeller protein
MLAFACTLPAAALLLASQAQTNRAQIRPAPEGTRGPTAIAFSADGARAYVAERITNTVSILDAVTGKLIARVDSGGTEPTGLALTDDGATLLVANNFSDTLGLIDTRKNDLKSKISLRGGPWSVVTAQGRAYVTLSRLDRVAVVDPATGKEESAISVGRRPRALALTPDGKTLLCANMSGGSLSVISTETNKETARLALGAVNLRGVAVRPDGEMAYVSGQVPHNDKSTADARGMWSNVLVSVKLGDKPQLVQTTNLDTPDTGAADPAGIGVSDGGILVALAGVHKAALLSYSDAAKADPIPGFLSTEANPVAVSRRPNGELWICNSLGNSIKVEHWLTRSIPIEPFGGAPPADRSIIRLDPPDRPDIRLRGRFLFTSAHSTKGGRFTCNTCHPDGSTEGLVWKFAHTKDGLDLRNTRDLRGVVLMTGPFGWTGRENDLEEFIEDEINGLLQGPKFKHGELHAFWDLVNQIELPPNPYRQADGSLTESAKRGKALFTGAAGCSTCHVGQQTGGTKKLESVGTTPAGLKLDVPHLQGSYDTAPYLHDGSAATLEEVFKKHNPLSKHGKAHQLTDQQLAEVLQYVREL